MLMKFSKDAMKDLIPLIGKRKLIKFLRIPNCVSGKSSVLFLCIWLTAIHS